MKFSEVFKSHLLKLDKLISYVFYHFVMKFSEDFIESSFEIEKNWFLMYFIILWWNLVTI